tara:strand:- start:2103 stop:3530 length:1428 start_codon:yes stop_codon:yes gene_type:complete
MWCIHSFQIPLLIVGLFFAIPLGWIIAMLQNVTVLGYTQDFGGRPLRGLLQASLRHSHYQWAQNHGILLVFCLVAFFTWINLVATCLMVPSFAKSFFGVESVFTLSPMAAVMNTTFMLGTVLLTYLVVSPMMKAAYVLRCFYAESSHTGEDLMSRLAACRAKRDRDRPRKEALRSRAAIIVILVSIGQVWTGGLSAESVVDPSKKSIGAYVSAEAFEDELLETMEKKKYQWQLSRRDTDAGKSAEESWLSRRVREIAETTREIVRKVGIWIEDMMDRFSRRETPSPDSESGSLWEGIKKLSSSVSIALVGVVIGLLVWLGIAVYRKHKGKEEIEVVDGGITGTIDLQSEDIVASQLPEGEWMRLAREQISKGDGRLAIRALFLASLANLGEEGILRIARFKSNRDYRRELELKVRKLAALRSAFDVNTTLFEEAWYGWHPVSEEIVDSFLENHRVIARESGTSGSPISALTGGVS